MCPNELTAAVNALGIFIANQLTPEQQILIASILIQLGTTIQYIIVRNGLCSTTVQQDINYVLESVST